MSQISSFLKKCMQHDFYAKVGEYFHFIFLILTLIANSYFPFWLQQHISHTYLEYFIMPLLPLQNKRHWIFIIWTDHVRVYNLKVIIILSFFKVFSLDLLILKLKCHIMSHIESIISFSTPLNYLKIFNTFISLKDSFFLIPYS